MKKLVFTLALGIFFVTFTNAQTADRKISETKQTIALSTTNDTKIACEPGCTKECCADKKTIKTESKNKTSKASLRPSSCADKKSSCASKKSSCKDKK